MLARAPNPRDPTGTSQIRGSFRKVGRLRLQKLRSQLRQHLIDRDALGLAGGIMDYHAESMRLVAFSAWLEAMAGHQLASDWPRPYIARAWHKGLGDALNEVGPLPSSASMDGIERLTHLAGQELDGLAAVLVQQVGRDAAAALQRKLKPHLAWRDLSATFDKVVAQRLNATCNVLTVKAYNQAKLSAYTAAGHRRVGIIPEQLPSRPVTDASNSPRGAKPQVREASFPDPGTEVGVATANDDRVCADCEDFADASPHEIDDVLDQLPMHVNCRCAYYIWQDRDDDQYDAQTEILRRTGEGAAAAVQATLVLGSVDEESQPAPQVDFDPARWAEELHPRVPKGEAGAGQFAISSSGEPVRMDPRVLDVGGDSYNKGIAQRLEYEYARVKPELEQLAKDTVGGEVEVDTEEPETYTPESWDEMSNDLQSKVEGQWFEETYQEFKESEENSWYDNGGALDQAKYTLANAEHVTQENWLDEALKDIHAEREAAGSKPIPYDNETLKTAINISFESNSGDGSDDPTIEFDDDWLKHPEGWVEHPSLPGIEAEQPEQRLTQEMRGHIEEAVTEAFNKKAQDEAYKEEPPDFSDSIKDMQEEYWSSMADTQKFNWAKGNTDLIGEQETGETRTAVREIKMPAHFDPMGKQDGSDDYRNTQALGGAMSVRRAADLIEARIPGMKGARTARQLDNRMWEAWKGSSTSPDGLLLQVAAAEEMGSRLNVKQLERGGGRSVADLKRYAEREYAGGFEAVKAYLRAKWEVSQYMLDKSDQPVVQLYRGLKANPKDEKIEVVRIEPEGGAGVAHGAGWTYERLPEWQGERNGAASFSTDKNVSESFAGQSGIMTRVQAPRTAILSVPSYGQNVHSEHEAVVMGTAWSGWDAWKADASPDFSMVPVAHEGVKPIPAAEVRVPKRATVQPSGFSLGLAEEAILKYMVEKGLTKSKDWKEMQTTNIAQHMAALMPKLNNEQAAAILEKYKTVTGAAIALGTK